MSAAGGGPATASPPTTGPSAARAAATRPASARASTSTAPSATRRSGPATWAPSSAATTRELPGAVYTKGFLRNYALYLGLDPEDVLAPVAARARRRRDPGASPVIVVPRPIAAPRPGLTFSPGVVVAALLTVVIAAFAVYLGVQLLRFAKPPTIAVTDPPAP